MGFERTPGGGYIRCTRTGKWRQPCYYCNDDSTILCDYPVAERRSQTCDRPTCRDHATRNPDGTDYCSHHAALAKLEEPNAKTAD